MRKKIFWIWIGLLAVAVLLLVVLPMSEFNQRIDNSNQDSYQGLNINKKYWTACGECTEYISKNNLGHAESVSVEEVYYKDVKNDIELMKGSYEDEDILWQLTFVLEGPEEKDLVMYCDPDYHSLRAVLEKE